MVLRISMKDSVLLTAKVKTTTAEFLESLYFEDSNVEEDGKW